MIFRDKYEVLTQVHPDPFLIEDDFAISKVTMANQDFSLSIL